MKVLFITFYFPPRPDVASIRTAAVCEGLLAAGHEVTVVTNAGHRASDQVNEPVFVQEYSGIGRLHIQRVRSRWADLYEGPSVRKAKGASAKLWAVFNRLASRFLTLVGFDPMVPWAVAAWAATNTATPYDCVLVSAGPFSTLFAGYALARTMGLPLVLDYRDVWNDTPHTALRLSTRWLERAILARTALVVSVSPSCLKSILGNVGTPSTVVTNGISDEVRRVAETPLQHRRNKLVYAGAFYPPKRSFEPIAAALAIVRARSSDELRMQFSYFGPSSNHVEEVARRHGVVDLVSTSGFVSRHDALAAQVNSLCTIVVTSTERTCCLADRGIVTGKLYEAIALAPWVLVVSPLGSDVRELTARLRHVRHFHGQETEAIADWLTSIAATPSTSPSADDWQEFTWPLLSAAFTASLETAVDRWPESRTGSVL